MATVSKLLIRLQKFSSKISTTVDATESFNTDNSFYQDLSGWDSAVVQFVGTSGTISFSTTNDNGSITGQLLPAPEVPTNWVTVLGVNLTTKADVSSINASGMVAFGIIGNYLLLQGSVATTTTAAP
jgi:predicted enzyme related to lactoylglutathione lyase